MAAYREKLSQFIYHSNMLMKPVFDLAKKHPNVWSMPRAKTSACCTRYRPWWTKHRPSDSVGRPAVIEKRIDKLGLRIRAGDILSWLIRRATAATGVLQRVSPADAASRSDAGYGQARMRRRNTLIAAMLVRMNAADAMLCGTVSQPLSHLRYIDEVIGQRPGANVMRH